MEHFHGKAISNDFLDNKLSWDKNGDIKKNARQYYKKTDKKLGKCPICNYTKFQKFLTIYKIDYLRCKRCKVVFTNKRVLLKKRLRYYKKDENIQSAIPYIDKKLLKLRENLVKPKIEFIKKYAHGKKWLDVGAGQGEAVCLLKKQGWDAKGLEPSKITREFVKKHRKIELEPDYLDEFAKTTTEHWNVISFFGVMDVTQNPMEQLKVTHKLLSKDGIIAISGPNSDCISSDVQMLTGEADRHAVPERVQQLFNLTSFRYAFKKIGFKPLAVWYYGMDMIELLKYIRMKDKNFEKSKLFQSLYKHLNDLQLVFDKGEYSDQLLVIAKKVKN